MKKGCLLIAAILISVLLSATALPQELDDIGHRARELSISVRMASSLEVVRISRYPMVMDLEWRIHYNPLDTWQQSVLTRDVSPTSINKSSLVFEWASPSEGVYNFSLVSDVLVKNSMVEIMDRVPFPASPIPAEAERYLQPSGNVDFHYPAITDKATELASGQDDLSQVAFNLFSWVADNIEYRRTDFTKSTTQSASWTIDNRYGVCDEITNLFIALCRSVGIPARYVSGIAYTNVDDRNTWEPHAWAELYFPGYGWVPFDPTYREYGYVDPTHIVLQYGIDSNQSTSTAKWIGRDAQVLQSQLDIQASLNQRFGVVEDQIRLEIEPLKQNLGFGSYTVIKADVKNPNYYYVHTDLTLIKATYFSSLDSLKKSVLLRPNEEKSIYWLIKIEEDLNPKFYYTLPILVITSRNTSSEANLYAKAGNIYYSREEMERLIPAIEEEARYNYSKRVDISCTPQKQEVYSYEEETITCIVRNTGNLPLTDIDVCLDEECSAVSLGLAESTSLNFSLPPAQQGIYEKLVKVRGSGIYKSTAARYAVLDEPSLSLAELSYPADIEYDELYKISCLIKHDSISPAYNVTLTFTNRQSESFNFTSLDTDQQVFLYFKGKNMKYGENKVQILLSYQDLNGENYYGSEEITIMFGGATFAERVNLFLTDVGLWLWQLFHPL